MKNIFLYLLDNQLSYIQNKMNKKLKAKLNIFIKIKLTNSKTYIYIHNILFEKKNKWFIFSIIVVFNLTQKKRKKNGKEKEKYSYFYNLHIL